MSEDDCEKLILKNSETVAEQTKNRKFLFRSDNEVCENCSDFCQNSHFSPEFLFSKFTQR